MEALVLVAAGNARRFGPGPSKVMRPLAGTPVIVRAAAPFRVAVESLRVVVVARPTDHRQVRAWLPRASLVEGGETRAASVRRAVETLPPEVQVALVHDAARPLVSVTTVRRVLAAVRRDGAAVAVRPLPDAVYRLAAREAPDPPRLAEAIDRRDLVVAQTPQAVRLDVLRRAIAQHFDPADPDEATLLMRAGVPVTAVPGDPWNFRIKVAGDLEVAERLLGEVGETA